VSERDIEEQLGDFKAHGIGGVFIHPRPGLITPYLSDEWLSRCAYAVRLGKSLGMKIWIYDENSYPSGFAGGNVPAAMPDAAGTGLRMTRSDRLPNPLPPETMLVLMRQGDGFMNITKTAAEHTGPGEYRLFAIRKSEPSPWYGGFTYVDIMRREVTEKFLEVTLDAYKRAIGEEFGKTVPGAFQDEAHIAPVGGGDIINYTPSLFDTFRAKWGYDLRPHLPSLYEEVGDWKRVRYNYYSVLLDLFIENWAKPYYDYCEKNGLAFTGHYWEHEWPNPRIGPDNLAMAAWAHMPGVDILMNEWATGPHSQFGNARAVKEIRSAANQLGRERTMSETYGAGGWDLTFLDQKRIGDWEYVLGVNFLNQHLSYVTIMGARKRDHPQSFSYHEPWWGRYGVLADYFGRLSAAMSAGVQENRILVLEPTTSAWMYAAPSRPNPRLDAIGEEFQTFVNRLEAAQVEYDLGSEETLARFGSAEGSPVPRSGIRGKIEKGALRVGKARYDLIVIPPATENLDGKTVVLLKRYLSAGGKVLAWSTPEHVDGAVSDAVRVLSGLYPRTWLAPGGNDVGASIHRISSPAVRFDIAETETGMFFHHRRTLRDGTLLFIVNTSLASHARGTFTLRGGSVERWDPFTGSRTPHPFARSGGAITVPFDLPEVGSLLLCIRPAAVKPFREPPREERVIAPGDPVAVERAASNVLTLDYCDLAYGDSTMRDLYFYDAQRSAFRHHGLPGNPWDSSVQYKTSILDLDRFPADSGFRATFRFTAARGVNLSSLRAVIERPELWRVMVNGTPVSPVPGEWRLDRAFGVFDIGGAAREGENTITLACSPFTIHSELEPIYLHGDFSLDPAEKGFTLAPSRPLVLGPWNDQGMPFYAEGVRYTHRFIMPGPMEKDVRCLVRLTGWKGSFAEARVNSADAGIIAFPPFELDVTGLVREGENRIEVTVYGTLKNTLGPHHGSPPLGRAWPDMFRKGAQGGQPSGSAYHTVGYGLTEDFRLTAVRPAR
jgi:hypothetical protein